jgi:hypothetical protein
MSALLTLVPWWGRALALLALVVVLIGFGWVKGNNHGTQKLYDFQSAQLVQSNKLLAARERVVHEVEVRWRTKTETITKEGEKIYVKVPVYVTASDDARCVVPIGFVREYNAGVANNSDTGPPSESDRADSGVSLSTVAETDIFNLTIGHRWRARAEQCIETYNAVKNAKAK